MGAQLRRKNHAYSQPLFATEAEILAFLKAEEAGERALETLCRTLCRDCAERLRNHASLPGGLLPYAAGALMKEECLCC